MLRERPGLNSTVSQAYMRRTTKRPWQVRATSPGRVGWFLVAPALIILLAMTVFPAVYLLRSSFFSFTLLSPESQFVGLQNYIYDLTNPDIRGSLLITLFFVITAVGLELVIGLLLALALARRTLENSIASTLLLLPFAVTPVVSALLWRELLNPNYGWVDYYLQRIGVMRTPVDWLSSPVTAWIALIGLDIWQWMPFVALILMAGLQGVPSDIKEAATVDGAGGLQQFWHITVPLLRPFIAIAVLLRIVQSFKIFDTVQILTGGGPGTATEVINLTIYRVALQDFSIGAASALGIMFLIVVMVIVSQVLRVVAHNTDLVEEK
jgi:multiple sugar transport system permease protein